MMTTGNNWGGTQNIVVLHQNEKGQGKYLEGVSVL